MARLPLDRAIECAERHEKAIVFSPSTLSLNKSRLICRHGSLANCDIRVGPHHLDWSGLTAVLRFSRGLVLTFGKTSTTTQCRAQDANDFIEGGSAASLSACIRSWH